MRVLRFGAELTGTGFFTVGLFVLPIAFALIGRDVRVPATPAAAPAAPVVHWTPPPGGGTDVVDASNAGDDSVETGQDALAPDPPELQSSLVGTPIRPARPPSTVGRASYGRGGGRGGGAGRVTMYRPAGHDRRFLPPPGTTRPRQAPRCDPQVEGIEPVGPDTYQVDRDLVDEYANVRRAKELVGWVGRHEDERGKMDGVQVAGIACGSPLSLAGIHNGDVVHSVNGIAITGIPSALLAYHKLRKSDVLEVYITRGGRPLHVTYRLT